MLQNAQYSVWFRTSAGEGHGIISLMDGDVSGADNISYYTGTYVQEGNKFAATIAVKRHTQGPPSVFGVDNVDITFSGKSTPTTASCFGTAKQAPGMTLRATLIRIVPVRLITASSNLSGEGDVFRALHAGLTVSLIITPTTALKTCTQHEKISDVVERYPEDFDFIPVVDENQRFIGMFNALAQRDRRTLGTVWQCFSPLSEENLIGADASILDFVLDADQRPCRLVISGSKIVGLVSISDLQRLPVRAALFALITGFEMTMANFIRQRHSEESDWLKCLAAKRRQKIEDEKSEAKADDSYVDTLLFTQFYDKKEIVKLQFSEIRREALGDMLDKIERLRNSVAHANEYASSRGHAESVCEVVRGLLDIKDELQAGTDTREF